MTKKSVFVLAAVIDQGEVNGWDNVLYDNIGAAYFYSTIFSNGSAARAWLSANSVSEK